MLLKKNIKLRIFLLSINSKKKIKLFFVLYDNKKK